ncbi:RNA-binding protein [Rhodovulum sulfidophilum]|nr:RNA-binding protein [Rhodovulum sulfidophilum DSM 1374]ANB37301.1 RNA-binding protein [Rhodovulum sulfidophilum]
MTGMQRKAEKDSRRMRGFERASMLLSGRIRRAGEKRGFAVARLLTHWPEVVGDEIARVCRPVEVRYGRKEGFGATLTLLTTGAHAPLLEMQKEDIREKVNACYGYAAISRIRLTQTAPTGFAEGQAAFAPAPRPVAPPPDPGTVAVASDLTVEVHDEGLRAALQDLGTRVLSRPKR